MHSRNGPRKSRPTGGSLETPSHSTAFLRDRNTHSKNRHCRHSRQSSFLAIFTKTHRLEDDSSRLMKLALGTEQCTPSTLSLEANRVRFDDVNSLSLTCWFHDIPKYNYLVMHIFTEAASRVPFGMGRFVPRSLPNGRTSGPESRGGILPLIRVGGRGSGPGPRRNRAPSRETDSR